MSFTLYLKYHVYYISRPTTLPICPIIMGKCPKDKGGVLKKPWCKKLHPTLLSDIEIIISLSV